MTLSEEARSRLADVVALQPTKNAELQERWEMDSGSEVHRYLEDVLGDYYFRDDNSLIRATEEAIDLVDVEPGIVPQEGDGGPAAVTVTPVQAQIIEVLAGPDEESESVVSVLHKLREGFDVDATAESIRSDLRSLQRKDLVEVVYRTVPTFRLAVERDAVDVDVAE